ncbi:oligopeptide/dipeptide ABC transporter ATP-binding protein, partial [Streptomyces sp. DT225]
PYTARLLAAVPTVDSGVRRPLVPIGGEPPALVDLPAGCPFASRCAVALDACRTDEPALRAVTGHGDVACLRADEIAAGSLDPAGGAEAGESVESAASAGDVVLRVEDLVKTFPVTKGAVLKRRVGTLHAVNGVGFELRSGETLGLVGESGSGKTTTLLEILRLKRPEGGRIEIAGTEVGSADSATRLRELRRDVQIVMQDPMGALD